MGKPWRGAELCSVAMLPGRAVTTPVRGSGSAGSALSCNYPQPGLDLARMMEDADIALYAAKVAGRGRHMTYGPEMRRAAPPPVARDDGSVAAAV